MRNRSSYPNNTEEITEPTVVMTKLRPTTRVTTTEEPTVEPTTHATTEQLMPTESLVTMSPQGNNTNKSDKLSTGTGCIKLLITF